MGSFLAGAATGAGLGVGFAAGLGAGVGVSTAGAGAGVSVLTATSSTTGAAALGAALGLRVLARFFLAGGFFASFIMLSKSWNSKNWAKKILDSRSETLPTHMLFIPYDT